MRLGVGVRFTSPDSVALVGRVATRSRVTAAGGGRVLLAGKATTRQATRPGLGSVPFITSTSFGIATNPGFSALIGQVLATNNPTSFAITGGNPSGFFQIASNGNLRTGAGAAPPDNNYSLTITATNSFGTSPPKTIAVTVGAVPVVNDQSMNLQLPAATGADAGSVVATSGTPTNFAITAGNAAGYFAIDNNGDITVTAAGSSGLTAQNYVLTVSATNALGTGTGSVTIVVAAAGTFPGAFNEQTGTFTIVWDAVPTQAAEDVVTGLSFNAPTGVTSMACIVRFFTTGNIDCRNGGAYSSSATVPYTAGTSYHFRLVVRVASHTYDVYVTPQGGSEILLANNFAFRTEQASAVSLNYLGKVATSGDVTLSNMIGPPPESLPPVVASNSFNIQTTGSGWVTGAVVGIMSATRSPTSWSITAGNSSGYYAISNSGVITVTSAGVSGLGNQSGTSNLTVQATNAFGNGLGSATVNYSNASATVWPVSMNDPMFTGMTELNSTLNLVSGTTYEKRSWINHSTDSWSALMANNTTCNTWRMRTREGPRYRGYTNTVFNNMMLEVFGLAGDHSDGVQWEGGTNAVIFRNCHFRGINGGHVLMFAADGARGSWVFEDCLFTNDGGSTQCALRLYADAGFGTITVSMKNCYVQQSGWAASQFDINRTTGTSACQVVLWDNVRNCSWNHSTGVLTPGGLIPQPSGT